MKTYRKIVPWALWLFLSILIFFMITNITSQINRKPITMLLNYQLWNETDTFCAIGLLCISIIIGLIITVLLLDLIRQTCNKAAISKLLATQKDWITECEKIINDQLNSKFKITLFFNYNEVVGQSMPIVVQISVEGHFQHSYPIIYDPSVDLADQPKAIAMDLINEYKKIGPSSKLYECLKNYTDFIAHEKKWTKPAKAIKTADS